MFNLDKFQKDRVHWGRIQPTYWYFNYWKHTPKKQRKNEWFWLIIVIIINNLKRILINNIILSFEVWWKNKFWDQLTSVCKTNYNFQKWKFILKVHKNRLLQQFTIFLVIPDIWKNCLHCENGNKFCAQKSRSPTKIKFLKVRIAVTLYE